MSDNLFGTGIRPAVDAYLKAESEKVRSYGNYWSASSAGYCMRLNIMRRLGVPKVPELEDSAAQTRIFEAGHIFHEWMQRITKNAGISIAQEVELQDEDLMIRGHFDDLVLIPMPEYDQKGVRWEVDGAVAKEIPFTNKANKLILYDYKTQNSQAFNYKRPISHYHTMQLGTYMYMLRKDNRIPEGVNGHNLELTEARILKISKDDLRMNEDQLMWSPQLEKEVYQYWSTLNGYWKAYQGNGTLPNCTCLDHEGGFMGKRSAKGKVYNDYFYDDEPCSQRWFDIWKEKQV